ncbi:MAG: L-serine ammonia-lyase [Gammaproteobacteria bacterium]|nr:L-serine ammonia-lyase [Gammaproteobacteria bacterium]
MQISVFDIFKIGIGPSSSHTVGPMRAARIFALNLHQSGLINSINTLTIELYGSLGATGRGHGSNKAILLGLEGETPEQVDPDSIEDKLAVIREHKQINLLKKVPLAFNEKHDLHYYRKSLPLHANGMRFIATSNKNEVLLQKDFYSVGGGFVIDDHQESTESIDNHQAPIPYPFNSAAELLQHCSDKQCDISQLMLENENVNLSETEIRQGLLNLWHVMQACVKRGLRSKGTLPGGIKVKRRAADLYQQLLKESRAPQSESPMGCVDWVNLYALAVNEENAAGGRVVTAPTNGAAGIIPAVLHYYREFCHDANDDGIVRFLLTAGAIAMLYKRNASISGAEVGCQGEVGVACSMAAGALTEVLGGTPKQVENAAEIGMEHNLGLTCDPVGGLVQIPCIERNAIGSVTAINAAQLALRGDGSHLVSLDKVIKTMRQTGADMKSKYKETSRGGLAVNIIEC